MSQEPALAAKVWQLKNSRFEGNEQGWIRTSEGVSQQIYGPHRL